MLQVEKVIYISKMCLHGRRSGDKSKDEARDETSGWESDDPATKNDEESLVIQGPEATARQEADRSSGTSDTVGGGHGMFELGAGQDSDRGGHLQIGTAVFKSTLACTQTW